MVIRSPYSARTARRDREPRFRLAARSMASSWGRRAGRPAKYRHKGPAGSEPAASKAGRIAICLCS